VQDADSRNIAALEVTLCARLGDAATRRRPGDEQAPLKTGAVAGRY